LEPADRGAGGTRVGEAWLTSTSVRSQRDPRAGSAGNRDGSAPPARTRRQVPPAPPRRSPHSGRFRGREPAAPLQHRTRRATVRPTVRTGQYGPPTMRLLVARCEVLYTGRLTARLPEAVRLLMFKADGSFLVHDDAGGFRPLNRIRSAFRPDVPAYLRLDVKVSGALA
jgi:hypothetical protein